MRKQNHIWNTWGRRLTVLLLLCGLLVPALPQANAASVTYTYKWIMDTKGLPTDNQWHDYFIAWEDLDHKNKVWFADYHWYTADGDNNIDAGGTHWMEYKAASTLPISDATSFSSRDSLGHMQIKYAGIDADNGNSPKYYIRVSKMSGGYSYFTRYEPSNKESSADAFTFRDKGDVFHIFVNIGGKADRYLTRDGQYLETTEASSVGGGDKYRALRVYQKTFAVDDKKQFDDVIGKTTLYEYSWVNTIDELRALADTKQWENVLIAWEDANGSGTSNPDKVWYMNKIWYDNNGKPNYENSANQLYYWSDNYLGSDGYGSPYAESFVLPSQAGHVQMKCVGWNAGEPVHGVKDADGTTFDSPVFQIRMDVGRGQYFYFGETTFQESSQKAKDFTVQLRLDSAKKNDSDYGYGSVHIFRSIAGKTDVYLTRQNNRLDVSDWLLSASWEFPFRIYSYREVEYDAIVQSFTVGRGATYSIDRQLILDEGVTITVEDGGVLMVDNQLLNNGNIVVKNGGTLIVNEGGYIMAYDQNAEGKITLDGGDLVIMDGAKVICDQGGGVLQAQNGATILNRGLLMVGEMLMLQHNSYLKNEADAMLLVGGNICQERGGVGAFTFAEIASRVKNGDFTYICATGSSILNKGIFNEPGNTTIMTSADMKTHTKHVDGGRVDTR